MYTTVSIHTNPLEAYIYKGRLEAEGIEGLVLFEHHIWAKWSVSHALGCVRLLAPSNMIEQASQVVRAVQAGEYEAILIAQQGLSQHACPRCGSTNNGVHAWLWKLALVFLFTLALPIPYTSHLFSCDDCKHSWIAREQRPYPLSVIVFYILLMPATLVAVFHALYLYVKHLSEIVIY
jgi:hypothetical protein